MEAEEELDLLNRYMLAKFPRYWTSAKMYFLDSIRKYCVLFDGQTIKEELENPRILKRFEKVDILGTSKEEALEKFLAFTGKFPLEYDVPEIPSFNEMRLWLEIVGK